MITTHHIIKALDVTTYVHTVYMNVATWCVYIISEIFRLEYDYNVSIILSSNSFFLLLFSFIFFFILIYSPPRSTLIKLLTITNYIIHTRLHCIHCLKTVLFVSFILNITEASPYMYSLIMIVLAVMRILNSQERINPLWIASEDGYIAALQECSWQWLPIAAKGIVAVPPL